MARTQTIPVHEAREAPEPLCQDICWLLSTASHSLQTEMTRAMGAIGLAPRGYAVLTTAMTGEFTQIEIARMIGLDKTTMVVTLDELEAAGLAERRPSPHDRRARVVAVTAAGRRKVRQAEQVAQRVKDDVLATLPARERTAFVDALTRLVRERLSEPVPCEHAPRRRAPRPAA